MPVAARILLVLVAAAFAVPVGRADEKPASPREPICLAEAVAIAERTERGTAVKAERRGNAPNFRFVVVVRPWEGKSSVIVVIDANGDILLTISG